MKKILVLVDFSASSVNAVAYAASLAGDKGFEEIILMSNCFVPLFEQIVPSPDLIQVGAEDIRTRMEHLMQQLVEMKTEIEKQLPATIPVRIAVGTQPLLRSVLDQAESEAPALVVIGSSRTVGDDCSIGRQVIPLAKVIPVPVLVIPPQARYHPLKTVLVAGTAEPGDSLRPLFGELENIPYTPTKKDILAEVLQAAEDRKVEMIVALPRKHSFFYNLTHQNITQAIVLNAVEPVLILK
ncbi:universal stress protein [Puia sp.]|uniref:universal stress protein n=1 Tax=Puia sp. TaxID=2045100 RepID=UPI002F42118F